MSITEFLCDEFSNFKHCGTPFNPVVHCDHFLLTNSQNPNRKEHKEHSQSSQRNICIEPTNYDQYSQNQQNTKIEN
ncbi:MAG: hypothetical protein CVU02_00565 [Bacteroidetes bacterium HGW-Bacteroidetes-19]|nr:MAG: hypothetical protein CVU04_01440 [Bacteroidetes bacterium HGW-Bacteroidetes-20]PKP28534.1 MAG: hypothetical protein CVU02_00565 [Bacteroidetes bacterium HGW-Bacteroidetes-19]